MSTSDKENEENGIPPPLRTTKGDRQIQLLNQLEANNRNVLVAQQFITEEVDRMRAPTISKRSQRESLKNIGKAANAIKDIMKSQHQAPMDILSPVPQLGYARKRKMVYEERQRQSEREQMGDFTRQNESTKEQFKRVLQEIRQNKARPESQSNKRQQRRLPIRKKKPDNSPLSFPPPANGKAYTVRECLPQIVAIEQRSVRLAQWRYLVEQKTVPDLEERTRQRMFTQCRAGTLDLDRNWISKGGRPSLVPFDKLVSIVKEKEDGPALTREFTRTDIKDILSKAREDKIREAGCVPLSQVQVTPCPSTIRNYVSNFSDIDGVSIKKTLHKKTETREIAENSLRCAASFMAVVGATHYVLVDKADMNQYKERRDEASQGANMFFELVSKAHADLPLHCIPAHYNFTTDEIASWWYGQTKESEPSFHLVMSKSLANAGTRSNYSKTPDEVGDGVRCKFAHTFANSGLSAAVFIALSGLTEAELPVSKTPDGVLTIEVEGLTLGGSGITTGDKRKGFILLTRKEKHIDRVKFRVYRDKVFLPFVAQCREEFDDWDGDYSTLTPAMKVASWQDGGLAQIASIVDDTGTYARLDIIANKHNPGRTAVEQSADNGDTFKRIHAEAKKTTLTDVNAALHPLKRKLSKTLKDLEQSGVLNLPRRKLKAFIDLVSCAPRIFQAAITSKGIRRGGLANGMLDEKTERYPCFNGMMATLGRSPRSDEYELVKKTMTRLVREVLNNGRVSEEVFDELGYPVDCRLNGEEYARDATITQEHLQQAKTMTHENQVQERKLLEESKKAAKQRKASQKRDKIVRIIHRNSEAEEKILSNCVEGQEAISKMEDATEAHFNACKADLLKAFLNVRSVATPSTLRKANLVRLAYANRDKEVVVKVPMLEENLASHQPTQPSDRHVVTIAIQGQPSQLVSPVVRFLEDPSWVNRVCRALLPDIPTPEISDELNRNADLLHRRMLSRFDEHITTRVINPSKREHWCLQEFARPNMAPMAAIIVLQGHAKMDIATVDRYKSLLGDPKNFRICSSRDALLQGSYLYYDRNRQKFVRAGKATGQTFVDRHRQHESASMLLTAAAERSKFYNAYPHRNAQMVSQTSRQGCFHYLTQYVAFGVHALRWRWVTKPYEQQGWFVLSPRLLDLIESVNFVGSTSSNDKCTHMIGYLSEFAYDLCLCPSDNLSENPGFETPLKIFDNASQLAS